MNATDMSNQFALDVQGFQRLQHTARVDPEAGVNGAAQQFEALFVQMMMKSMRDAIPTSGLMNSSATDTYQQMLDQQWSQVISSKGVGLADVLIEQLKREGAISNSDGAPSADQQTQALIAGIPRGTPRILDSPLNPGDGPVPESASESRFLTELAAVRQDQRPEAAPAQPETKRPVGNQPPHVDQFMQTLASPAKAASATTGVPAELILAQAALETGWGRHEIATRSGANSHNLFGIKAGSQWQGETTDIVTHEYIDGRRTQVVDSFRVYDSYEHAFTDYASLIGNNPRYAGVVDAPTAEHAARELQRGGYATDPLYADKLVAVMNSIGPLNAGGDFLADSR
ncbi:flagellar assembly peptidoglycan hydrolase FlgJ [Halovibrio sp. HP20-50]|uniref:flagellar assembly peptidoglycan hydrolase FlgJ n=1 Tax=Halovibrio sp. HP20-59 TaxID=3080275 RepID=UPI00294B68BB|nr:flagellar assembly peptidoglycan hydrolase FlgJ [Halovibrio sp. HP20-59]MEA2119466.1 flagellar assembly peptidoglycan hydrolase FlgJ [Halovibrio sp. HP20-59]